MLNIISKGCEYILIGLGLLVSVFLISAVVLVHTGDTATGVEVKQRKDDARYFEMYKKLVAQTGQVQDTPEFMIVEDDRINAYTDGHKIVIYRGMLNYAVNDDEIALVLGHELAHVMLGHTDERWQPLNELDQSVREANADKMGELYVIKTGLWDVCKAREMWKRFRLDGGNYQGGDHPDYSYRFDELNVNCE